MVRARGRGMTLVEVPDEEFESMGTNILALAPRRGLILAGNPQTRSEDLGHCARLLGGHLTGGRGETNAFRAGVALACSPSTPFDEILNLLAHPTTCMNFRKVVARESSRPDVLTKLAEDRSARVRAVAQRRRA